MRARAGTGILLALAMLATGALAQTQAPVGGDVPVVPVIPVVPVSTPGLPGFADLEVISPAAPLPAKARTNVFLSVLNQGPGPVSNVSVFVQPGGGGVVVIGQVERDLQTLPEGDSALLVVRVATPDSAGGIGLVLSFAFTDAQGVARTLTRTVSLQVAPPESAPLEVTYDGTPLEPGGDGALPIRISNPSDRAITQLDVTVQSEEQFTPFLGIEPDITPGQLSSRIVQGATLGPGESVLVRTPVVASLKADDLVMFTVTAVYTFQGYQREQRFEFGARTIGTIQIRVLEAREVATERGRELAGIIVNTGTGTAYNPLVDVAAGSGLEAAAPKLVEDLEPNDAVEFRLPVERVNDPQPGAPLLVVEYNDDYGTVRPSTVAGDYVPLPPPTPSAASVWLARLTSFWGIIAIAALVLFALVASIVHLARTHRAAMEAEPDEEAAEDELEAEEREWKRKQKPKQRPGAKPG